MRSQENHSRIVETAALAGITLAAFLGKAGVKPAMAMPETKAPNTPENIEGGSVIWHPPGVKVLSGEAATAEMRTTLQNLHLRWEGGVLVLHRPIGRAIVSFATSPSSYRAEPGDLSVGYDEPESKVIYPNPAFYISPKTHHLIAVGQDAKESTWGACDITYANSVGAASYYQIAGKHARVAQYPFRLQEEQPPYILDTLSYNPTWSGPLGRETLVSITLPDNTDSHKKVYQLQPVKAPHVK